MDLYEVIKIPKHILQFFGMWPSDHSIKLSNVRWVFSFLIVMAFCGLLLTEAVHIVEDFVESLSVLLHFSLHGSCLMKILAFKAQEANLTELYTFLADKTLVGIPLLLQHHVLKPFRLVRIMVIGFSLSCVITVSLLGLFPLVSGNQNLPIRFTVFDLGYFRPLIYVFQCFSLTCSTAINACFDLTAIGLMCLVKGQVCVLYENLRFFRKNALEREDSTDEGCLAECVNHHNKIIVLVELSEKVFSSSILVQYLTSVLVICNIGFQLVTVDMFSPSFLLMVSFFVAVMFQLGMYCWFGNEVILNSTAIREACYKSDWINADPRAQRMLLIVMERSKRPLYLTAGKFSVLSLTSFTSVLNSAYSFFALMQKMYRKSEDP